MQGEAEADSGPAATGDGDEHPAERISIAPTDEELESGLAQ